MTDTTITKENYYQVRSNVITKEKALRKEDRILINQEVDNQSASLPTLWIIWLCFGMFGGHRFYMRLSKATLMLAVTIVGYLTSIFLIGLPILCGMLIWKIIDACHLCQWVKFQRLTIRRHLVDKANA